MEETQENLTKEEQEMVEEYNKIWGEIQENMFDDTEMDSFIQCIIEEKYAALIYRGVGIYNEEVEDDSCLIIGIHRKDIPIVVPGNTMTTSNCVVKVSEETGKLQYPLVTIVFEDFYPSNKKIKFIKFSIFHELGHVYEMCNALRDIAPGTPVGVLDELVDISVSAEIIADTFARIGLKLTRDDMIECLQDIKELIKSMGDKIPLATYIIRLQELYKRIEYATEWREDNE